MITSSDNTYRIKITKEEMMTLKLQEGKQVKIKGSVENKKMQNGEPMEVAISEVIDVETGEMITDAESNGKEQMQAQEQKQEKESAEPND